METREDYLLTHSLLKKKSILYHSYRTMQKPMLFCYLAEYQGTKGWIYSCFLPVQRNMPSTWSMWKLLSQLHTEKQLNQPSIAYGVAIYLMWWLRRQHQICVGNANKIVQLWFEARAPPYSRNLRYIIPLRIIIIMVTGFGEGQETCGPSKARTPLFPRYTSWCSPSIWGTDYHSFISTTCIAN